MKIRFFLFLVLLTVGMITSFAEKGTVIDTDEEIQSVLSIDDCEAVIVFSENYNVDSELVMSFISKSTNLKRDTDLILSAVVVEQESRGSPTITNFIPLKIELFKRQGLSSGGLPHI